MGISRCGACQGFKGLGRLFIFQWLYSGGLVLSIQILGLRDYIDQKTGKVKKKHAFFECEWQPESVAELFSNLDYYIERIPEHERWNLYFTVAHCLQKEARDCVQQDVIPLDVDNVELGKLDETIATVLESLHLDKEKTAVLCSGNGLQFFIQTTEFDAKYIEHKRVLYKIMVQKVNRALVNKGLKGECDPVVWDIKRLMRLPGTMNRKPKGDKRAYLIQSRLELQGFIFEKAIGLAVVEDTDQISLKALKSFPAPDTKTILKGCEFLKYAGSKENQPKIQEPEWYAMLSIVGHLEEGKKLAHEYSKWHPGYSQDATDEKLEQATTTAGPRTCKNINDLWGKCSTCAYNGKVKSPILIQGKDFIRTKSTGFHDVIYIEGRKPQKKPNYNDLLRYFEQKNPYFVQNDTGLIYTFNGVYWEEYSPRQVKAFAEKYFDPKPTESMRSEFKAKVEVNNLRDKAWYDGSTIKKICLENGVYDLSTDELLPHSDKYFFTGCLPYKFDRLAKAPRFEKFMDEITCGSEELKRNLLEYAGYAISGDPCWVHKALIMQGEGSNGKSTFLDVLKALVGERLYSGLSISALEDPAKREMLVGKYFNIGEETNVHSLARSEVFKTAVGGGELDMKRLYMQPFMYRNKAKLIFACNRLPYTNDLSTGFFRRLLIVPFKATFMNGTDNKMLKQELLNELPGILNILITSYKNLCDRKDFLVGEQMEAELTAYKNDNNYVWAWIKEKLEVTEREDDFVTTKELFEDFCGFCEERRVPQKAYSFKHFHKELDAMASNGRKIRPARKREGANQPRGFTGIKLHSDF